MKRSQNPESRSQEDRGLLSARHWRSTPIRPIAISPIRRFASLRDKDLVSPSRVYWLRVGSPSDSAMARAHDSSVTKPLTHFPRRAALTASHLLRPPAKAMTGFFE